MKGRLRYEVSLLRRCQYRKMLVMKANNSTVGPEHETTRCERLSEGVSVIVPVYNSEGTIVPLLERLEVVLQSLDTGFETILVNDGSLDRSWEQIDAVASHKPFVRGINLMRNYGQHNALLCGIRAARFDTVITIDDDLQNPPEEIPILINKLSEGFDVVYGTPEAEQHGLLRNAASKTTKFVLSKAMGADTAGKISAFRAFRTRLIAALSDYDSPSVCLDVLLTWTTTKFGAVSVKHEPRTIGISNYTVRKLISHAMNMLTGFDTAVLRMASVLGFGFSLFGFALLFYVLAKYLLFGSPVQGFPFLASIIAIFSGAQLLSLGIIGEYLARIHYRMMNRPTYCIMADTAASGGPQA